MGGLGLIIEQLNLYWKALILRWEETKTVWNDPVRREFDKVYWQALERQTHDTMEEMQRLAQTTAKARQSVK